MLKAGQKAPEFEIPDVNGKKVKLSELLNSGKKIVLVFYRGGWCPLCSKQLAILAQDYLQFTQKNALIVGISNEKVVKGRELLGKLNLPFILLADEESRVIEAYGVKVEKRELMDIPAQVGRHKGYALPSVFLIGKDGRIFWQYIGKTYRDRPQNSEILAHL